MRKFHSNADEIRYYFEELLSDGMEHDRKEMIQHVRTHAANSQRFTEGMYTGALRNMMEMNEAYICVRRGIYQKRTQAEEESSEDILSNRVLEILSNAKEQLSNCSIRVFDISRMSERDKKVVEQIDEIMEDLDRLINRLN